MPAAASTYPHATWRLLRQPIPAAGDYNMALDEAILRQVAAGESPPTLRLYAWDPPTITLGRGQPYSDIDLPRLEAAGYGLVRRPTGGRAVLHTDELTYAALATEGEPRLAGGIVESYRALSEAILAALNLSGLENVHADSHVENRGFKGAVCFEMPSDYEITFDGRKLVGSAQMRIQGGILQHGTLPLTGDIARVGHYLVERPDPERIRARALTLHDALGYEVTWETLAEAFERAFSARLNLTLQPGALTAAEVALTAQLRREKYANPAWTARV